MAWQVIAPKGFGSLVPMGLFGIGGLDWGLGASGVGLGFETFIFIQENLLSF